MSISSIAVAYLLVAQRFCKVAFLLLILNTPALACSMYKVTLGDKTVVGCNEDAWRTTSKIWFETAKSPHEYGCAFTGSRVVGKNRFAPQSGMNDQGLVFSRLASYHPVLDMDRAGKKEIADDVQYLKDILHTCQNIAEVKRYVGQFDRSNLIDDVFIYIDQTGKYLIVEPYQLIEGDDPYYVLSNFCPSIRTNEQARALDRYRNGEDFLKIHGLDTTRAFCTALSDTMHVCRSRNGDGTLLSSHWDTKNSLVNLYFYHNYDTTVQYDLSKELAKGDHMVDIIELFPPNAEFQQLIAYKNPFNVPFLRFALVLLAGFFLVSSFAFLVHYFRKSTGNYRIAQLLIGLLGFILAGYMFVLATNMNIYYFDAPYIDPQNHLISAFSYTPMLLAISMIPIYRLNIQLFKEKIWTWFFKWLFSMNTIAYTVLFLLFMYWGLFDVFH